MSVRATLSAAVSASIWVALGSACTVFDGAESQLATTGAGGDVTSVGGSSSTQAGGAGGSGGSLPICIPQFPNGICADNESCSCPDCTDTLLCDPFACHVDAICSINDHCTCEDCKAHPACVDPGRANCLTDQICSSNEGCLCADCQSRPECVTRIQNCTGGVVDNVCDVATETCECPDCAYRVECVGCLADGECAIGEGCYCTDCAAQDYCLNCTAADGVCNALLEGCTCADCSALMVCN